ncbi:hypothetical protein ikelab_06460 [Lactococcus garvieae]|uniref:Uncharacterized protein n=1 Tax=Lactococcus garvieae TaxID=1363 RepID=A0A6L2ZUI7_9LACT|nr:hypothetical protein ikelab_06460 [Lactococcus garvieae]
MALEHCQELMEKVETIEDKLHQLEVIKIEFRQEIQNKINYRSALLSFSFPVLILAFYIINDFSFIHGQGQLDRSALETFLITFMLSFSLWALGIFLNDIFKKIFWSKTLPMGRKALIKQLFPKYNQKSQWLIESLEELLACETLTNTELPERYMNIKSLSYIIEVLRAKDAHTLREAVELLELEIKNIRVEQSLLAEPSIRRAQEAIASRYAFKQGAE